VSVQPEQFVASLVKEQLVTWLFEIIVFFLRRFATAFYHKIDDLEEIATLSPWFDATDSNLLDNFVDFVARLRFVSQPSARRRC